MEHDHSLSKSAAYAQGEGNFIQPKIDNFSCETESNDDSTDNESDTEKSHDDAFTAVDLLTASIMHATAAASESAGTRVKPLRSAAMWSAVKTSLGHAFKLN